MGLIDRVSAIFRRRAPQDGRQTTSDELETGRPVSSLALVDAWRAATDRQSLVRACREMYRTDPRARGVINTLARDMVRGGFTVEVRGGDRRAAEAQAVADALVDRLDLLRRLDDWIRLSLRDGDSFLELAVDGGLEIADVSRKPALEVRRNSDDRDQFADPRRAFWQAHTWAQTPPADAIWFAEWQLIHARWDHDEGSRYGEPLFGSALKPARRMQEGETDLAVRRKTRAGLKYVHQFPPGTDSTIIEQYKRLNRDSLDNPTAAIADFFGTVDIKAVQGDAQIGTIDDVLHHIRTWWLASPVPMSLLGYGQDLNRDVLQQQQEQYGATLIGLRLWPEREIIRPLIERQWLLKGIWPDGLEYALRWQSQEVLSAAMVEKAANAALKLRAVGVNDVVVAAVLTMLLPGVDVAGLGQFAAGPETRATAERMARAADEWAGRLMGRA